MANDLIPIRLSHIVGQSGVGAIVRGPRQLVVVHDTRTWTDRNGKPAGNEIPYVERVRAALEIPQALREPPIASEGNHSQVQGVCIPASRFPSWMRCPACGALYERPWRDLPGHVPISCRSVKCRTHPLLEQLTWVLADPDGHLADVPWYFLCHAATRDPQQRACEVRDHLRLIERGFEDRTLRCDACGANTHFRGNEPVPFGHGRMQPWTTNDLVMAPSDEGAELAQVLAINDTRVYRPATQLALVIPPESRIRKGTAVDRLYRNSGDRARVDTARTALARKSVLKTLATTYRCTVADLEDALRDLRDGYPLYGENPTAGQLLESEYDAFLERIPDQKDDEDLVTHHQTEEWHQLGLNEPTSGLHGRCIEAVSALVRVSRLKGVRVFRGFSRIDQSTTVPPDIVNQSNWLPAIELYGEGIFVTLSEARLRVWEKSAGVMGRLQAVEARFKQSGRDQPNPLSARFILLHTLSHLLIRQIESEGGYPAASLSEQLYCSTAPKPMAGILIRVLVPDVAGSLGGLAELADPKRFLALLVRALEHAQWCSLDPVCRESQGQGPALLNRAACHACALVPEPACGYENTLLDRTFVKGDPELRLPAFFAMDNP
ncbi:MAG: DUF1998 domain-containing protein [Xanthomonadales bacterium]|nr:DUF1998 domain-containing protein [Xanthomonadales bacterium]